MNTVSREETQAKVDLLAGGVMKHTPEGHYSVADRFESHAAAFGERTFLIYQDNPISYGELNAVANQYAGLAIECGLRQGDVAAVMLNNRPEFFYAWLGLAKIGVIATLVNTQAKGQTLEHAIAETGSSLIFVGTECLAAFNTVAQLAAKTHTFIVPENSAGSPGSGMPVVPEGASLITARLPEQQSNHSPSLRSDVKGEDPFWYVFTSGTTGLPKAAVMSHARWLGVGDGWSDLLGITSADVFYCVLPLFHGAAGMSLLSNAVAAGASVVVREKFSVSQFWDDVRRYGITTTQYIGEICRYLVNQPPRTNDRDHTLKRMTGAGITRDIWLKFLERFGDVEIYEGWGATEANCSMCNLDQRIGSCGRIPFKDRSNGRLVRYNVELDCHERDGDGRLVECKPGEVGELIGMILEIPGIAAGRFEGYTSAQATENKIMRNVFQDGDAWFRSGDLFVHDEEDYFYFADRIGDTFRWKSENVSTTEVSEVLSAYADAQVINVYGVSVPEHEGRAGMAAVELDESASFDPENFYRIARQGLPDYAVPLFVRVGGESDMTATFKLRKVDLQKQGYDPHNFADQLYVLDSAKETFSPYDEVLLDALGIKPFVVG